MQQGKCFDCKKTSAIHQHHLHRPDPTTIPLCPKCHKRRHSAGQTVLPLSEYLTDEQRSNYARLGEQKRFEIQSLYNKYQELIKQDLLIIEHKHDQMALTLLKHYLGDDLPNYSTISYPKPIWTLNFFSYCKPKEGRQCEGNKAKITINNRDNERDE